ncbi:3-hydroxyacyl-ACP dehydratase FabZ family protein [Nocardia sp. CC227C]|uniref:3-hydroxyacyl-ACP dehydratase FabZ family protein n=1 Tax=Nocardia sp. CC227C TaxID=3044562 RepID=UPI00278BD3DE|nr:hypothetical protein [Nocardia sp. CC227C]
MRFHLIDRIDDWVGDTRASARKLTSVTENHWLRDDSGRLTMPPTLVMEAVCQTASWLVLLSSGLRRRATLLGVDEVAWHGEVVPGDVLHLTVSVRSTADAAAVIDGAAGVDERPVLTASGILCGVTDADALEYAEDTERMARLLRGREPVA